jgi:hypothetical protein
LKVEIANAEAMTGTVVAKKRGTTYPGDWYAIMPFGLLVELLKEANY